MSVLPITAPYNSYPFEEPPLGSFILLLSSIETETERKRDKTKMATRRRTAARDAGSVITLLFFTAFIFFVWIADGSTVENAKAEANIAAGEAQIKAAGATQDAKETTDSWAVWAKEKLAYVGINLSKLSFQRFNYL